MNITDLKLRYYRGEEKCPWNGEIREEFKKAHFWLFERFAAEAGAHEIISFYEKIKAKKNDPYFWDPALYDANVTEGEKAVAAYCMFVSDMSMPASALNEYFSEAPFVSDKMED